MTPRVARDERATLELYLGCMTREVLRFSFDLLPYIEERKAYEVLRASRARTRTKVKNIPIRFPSVNKMYPPNGRRPGRHLSDEGRIYKAYIAKCLDKSQFKIPSWDRYYVTYVFFMTHEMMFTKNGDVSEHDVSNFLKATEDALFEWLLESDATVLDVHGSKRLTVNDPKVVILMSEARDGDCVFHRGQAFDTFELETDEQLVR